MTALTAEEMAALWLPLMSVPALGLSVRGQAEFVEGTVVGESGHAADSEVDVHDWGQNRTVVLPRIRATMNLADASTRDRVARWLAGRVGVDLACTSPVWGIGPFGTYRLWSHGHGQCTFGEGVERKFGTRPGSKSIDLPEVADLDPLDERTLPDGSRYVDALALARVALHVGSRP